VEGITRSQGGIGALLMNQNRHFDLAAIIAIQLTILVYGLLQDYLLLALRNVLCPHAALVRSK
jgi:NitT/TauT family transport system permease protein